MRMLMRVQLPVERANDAIKDGTLEKTIQGLIADLQPEAAYFLALDGKRTALLFFDMKDVSQIPVAAEPAFLALDASVDFIPVMNADELGVGLRQALG